MKNIQSEGSSPKLENQDTTCDSESLNRQLSVDAQVFVPTKAFCASAAYTSPHTVNPEDERVQSLKNLVRILFYQAHKTNPKDIMYRLKGFLISMLLKDLLSYLLL